MNWAATRGPLFGSAANRAAAAACALLVCTMAGCVSKSRADAQAKAAFIAGQQQAMVELLQRQNAIKVIGPVKCPVIPWDPEMTLAKALVAAEYNGSTDPVEIILVRGGLATRFDVKELLAGHDVPVQAGDIVQIR